MESSINKTCKVCNIELIPGENIAPSQWKIYNYKCKTCRKVENIKRNKNPKFQEKQKEYVKRSREKNPNAQLSYVQKQAEKWGSGVYGIFENGICLYVGESIKLYKRIVEHKTMIKYPEKTFQPELYKALQQHSNLIFGVIEETDNHKEKEKYYINKLKPKYNEYGM
jgi:hypothetical protein